MVSTLFTDARKLVELVLAIVPGSDYTCDRLEHMYYDEQGIIHQDVQCDTQPGAHPRTQCILG